MITSRNPHDPADVVGQWPEAGDAEVAAAVDRAAAAAGGWTATSAPARAAALTAAAAALEGRAATSRRPRCSPTGTRCPRPAPVRC